MTETYPHKHSRRFSLPPSSKVHRSTIGQAPYYLSRRLPFVAAGGSLSARIDQGAEGSHYLVHSNAQLIAESINGGPFRIPMVGSASARELRHQGIVRRAAAEVSR